MLTRTPVRPISPMAGHESWHGAKQGSEPDCPVNVSDDKRHLRDGPDGQVRQDRPFVTLENNRLNDLTRPPSPAG